MIEGKFYPSKKQGICTLYYRLRKSRTSDYKVTIKHIKINAESWDTTKQKFNRNCILTNYAEVQKIMQEFDSSVYELNIKLMIKGQSMNNEILKNHYLDFFNLGSKTKIDSNTYFTSYYSYYIERNIKVDEQSVNGKNLGKNTIKGYKSTFNIWKKFDKNRNIKLCEIDYKIFSSFIKFQETKLKYSRNTIATNKNKLNAILKYAYKSGIDVHQDFIRGNFVYKEEETDSEYLTQEEISSIINLNFIQDTTIDYARDWFVLQLFTALRVSDLFVLTKNNFIKDFIIKKTRKTGKEVIIPILPETLEIIKKYNGLPNKISEQQYNYYIKKICELAL